MCVTDLCTLYPTLPAVLACIDARARQQVAFRDGYPTAFDTDGTCKQVMLGKCAYMLSRLASVSFYDCFLLITVYVLSLSLPSTRRAPRVA